MTANRKSGRLKEPVRVRTKKLADGSESYYLDIYVDGKRSYEFLKMYHLPEVNAAVREQNRATRAAVETIKSQRIIDITNSKAGIKTKSAWAKLALADWMERFYALQERKGIRKIEKLRSVIKVVNQYGRNTKMGDIDKSGHSVLSTGFSAPTKAERVDPYRRVRSYSIPPNSPSP